MHTIECNKLVLKRNITITENLIYCTFKESAMRPTGNKHTTPITPTHKYVQVISANI